MAKSAIILYSVCLVCLKSEAQSELNESGPDCVDESVDSDAESNPSDEVEDFDSFVPQNIA